MTTIEALRTAATQINRLVDNDVISAGHITITPIAARLTLFLQHMDHMLHVENEILWDQLEAYRGCPRQLLEDRVLELVGQLCGEPGEG